MNKIIIYVAHFKLTPGHQKIIVEQRPLSDSKCLYVRAERCTAETLDEVHEAAKPLEGEMVLFVSDQ